MSGTMARTMGRWTLQTANAVPSLNDLLRWKANRMMWRYKNERARWRRLFGNWQMAERIPDATARRRLTVVRVFAGRQRAFDSDNIAGGLKPLIDALKPASATIGTRTIVAGGLILDDNDAGIELLVSQRRGGVAGTEITLEDLCP